MCVSVCVCVCVCSPDTDATAAKRSKPEEEGMLDMQENQENPLRCPVRLYEFYLSKW